MPIINVQAEWMNWTSEKKCINDDTLARKAWHVGIVCFYIGDFCSAPFSFFGFYFFSSCVVIYFIGFDNYFLTRYFGVLKSLISIVANVWWLNYSLQIFALAPVSSSDDAVLLWTHIFHRIIIIISSTSLFERSQL